MNHRVVQLIECRMERWGVEGEHWGVGVGMEPLVVVMVGVCLVVTAAGVV